MNQRVVHREQVGNSKHPWFIVEEGIQRARELICQSEWLMEDGIFHTGRVQKMQLSQYCEKEICEQSSSILEEVHSHSSQLDWPYVRNCGHNLVKLNLNTLKSSWILVLSAQMAVPTTKGRVGKATTSHQSGLMQRCGTGQWTGGF